MGHRPPCWQLRSQGSSRGSSWCSVVNKRTCKQFLHFIEHRHVSREKKEALSGENTLSEHGGGGAIKPTGISTSPCALAYKFDDCKLVPFTSVGRESVLPFTTLETKLALFINIAKPAAVFMLHIKRGCQEFKTKKTG